MTRKVERPRWLWLGLALLLVAILLPTGWYDKLPTPKENLPEPPLKGVTLVRLCFGLEGICILLLAFRSRIFPRLSRQDCLSLPGPPVVDGRDLRFAGVWLALATLLGAFLRLYRLGSDLWLDEITTVLDYRTVSPFHILTAYTSSNNHLLNTLLVKGMVGIAGLSEWWIRLPAALLGIACIPAQYFLARQALSRRDSVLSAFLLAVSYHHIFFSQNARGYTGLWLWSVLGTVFFLRAVSENRTRDWVLYVFSMLLAVATVLYGLFILAGHVVTLAIACWLAQRENKQVSLLAKKAAVVWAILAMLCLHLYASVIPQVYSYLGTVYTSEAVGYSPFSLEHLKELQRGLTAGFGAGEAAGALLVMAVLIIGLIHFVRRQTVFSLALIAPLFVTALFLLILNLRFSPRFFLWAVPAAFIFVVAAAGTPAGSHPSNNRPAPPRRRVIGILAPVMVTTALILLSLISLRTYYRVPKQPTRQSLEWLLAHRATDDLMVAVYLAKWGFRFYSPRFSLEEGRSFLVVHSEEELQQIERENPGKAIWIATTFSRALRIDYGTLERYIEQHYKVLETFPATIGDGEISIWKR